MFKLGRREEARAFLLQAREEAESMDAKSSLWSILFHLSLLEKKPEETVQLRQRAGEIIAFIANNLVERPKLRESFLNLPEVRAVTEQTN